MKMNVTRLFKTVKKIGSKHAPEILLVVGIGGMIATTVEAVKATPKALKKIEEVKEETEVEELTPVEVVKATWKCYIPSVVLGTTSIVCLVGGNRIGARRSAALITALNVSQTALSEYKNKMVEVVGEEKTAEIKEKVSKEIVDKNPVSKSPIIDTDEDDQLFYDYMSGRYFKSSKNKIEAALNKIYGDIVHGADCACLNDFYNELGLPHTGTGDILGWNVDNRPQIDLSRATTTDDGRSAVVMTFWEEPIYDYEKLY